VSNGGFGKAFAQMYEGSMAGSGSHVFAVWGYIIAHTDPNTHTVRLNPKVLSAAIGDPCDRIQEAIDVLCQPDPNSTTPDHDGRRLLHQSGFEYFVVTHEKYRGIKTGFDRTAYQREYMRKYREQEKKGECKTNKGLRKPNPVSVSDSDSAEGESEGEAFERCWVAFGRYGVKKQARKYWKALKPEDRIQIDQVIPVYLECVAAGRTKSQFEGWINPDKRKWDVDWHQALADLTKGAKRPGRNPVTKAEFDRAADATTKNIRHALADKDLTKAGRREALSRLGTKVNDHYRKMEWQGKTVWQAAMERVKSRNASTERAT